VSNISFLLAAWVPDIKNVQYVGNPLAANSLLIHEDIDGNVASFDEGEAAYLNMVKAIEQARQSIKYGLDPQVAQKLLKEHGIKKITEVSDVQAYKGQGYGKSAKGQEPKKPPMKQEYGQKKAAVAKEQGYEKGAPMKEQAPKKAAVAKEQGYKKPAPMKEQAPTKAAVAKEQGYKKPAPMKEQAPKKAAVANEQGYKKPAPMKEQVPKKAAMVQGHGENKAPAMKEQGQKKAY